MGKEGGQVHSKHPSQGVNKAQKAPLSRADVRRRGPLIYPGGACTKSHARSAERHKRKRAAIATPAVAVAMVTITTTPVGRGLGC